METEHDNSERQLYINQKLDIIGQLAGGISHNFNNQLTGIMGFANLIALRANDDNIKKFAEEILGICKNAGDIVRELLTFARYRPATAAGTDVHKVISTIIHLLSNSIDKRISIEHTFGAEQHVVLADTVQLQSTLLNLALNSKDAMPAGGAINIITEFVGPGDLIDVRKNIAPHGYIRIVVTDNGIGFGSEVKARLFEPFFTTKERPHAGLGLSAAYRFVKSMNGTIDIDSEEGKGTSVVVLLPIHICADNDQSQKDAGVKKEKKRGGTVLLADDDKSIRDSVSAFLRGLGYGVFTAEDGVDAVNKYGEMHAGIDLVILDMIMPRMEGKEAFIAMKEINPAIKAIGITGFTKHSAEEMTRLGMGRIMHKPFAFDELSNAVAEYI